jgi:hypothetical protein
LLKFIIRSKTAALCCKIVSVVIIIVAVMLLLCCTVIDTGPSEFSSIIFILIYILIFLVLCCCIYCIYCYKLWTILTLLLTIILPCNHISLIFCYYISYSYSYPFISHYTDVELIMYTFSITNETSVHSATVVSCCNVKDSYVNN